MAAVEAVRQRLGQVDDAITLSDIETMESRLADTLFQARFRSALVAVFALVTLILAAMGLYGVMAYFVRHRRHDIGVRRALGAGGRSVAQLVMVRGMALVAGGILIGLTGAFAGARLIQGLLFDIGPADALTLLGVSLMLVVIASLACLGPTLQAVHVDPAEVMKAE